MQLPSQLLADSEQIHTSNGLPIVAKPITTTSLLHYPFVRLWDGVRTKLPVRAIRSALRGRASSNGQSQIACPAPPFDFCKAMSRLCEDVVSRCPIFRHIDVSRLLIATTQARNGRLHGLQARVTPLRFRDGKLHKRRRGAIYQVQRYLVGDKEMLYVVTFCMPRFMNQPFEDKLITVFHELYHISPAFDGDLRRMGERYAMHSHSKRSYDIHMAQLSRAYLTEGANPTLHEFLRLNFQELQRRHGLVLGVVVPRPKLIPLQAPR